MKSEFGTGFIYNLVLFAKHWKMMSEEIEKMNTEPGHFIDGYDLWFNGASDHFYELEVPEKWKKHAIGRLAKKIQTRALYLGHGFKDKATKKDYDQIFVDLEKLARMVDKELGIKTKKAEWN